MEEVGNNTASNSASNSASTENTNTQPVLSLEGLEMLLAGLRAARRYDVDVAGEAVWGMTEDDVNAGLFVISIMQQALLSVGTNYQLGRVVKAEGAGQGLMLDRDTAVDPEGTDGTDIGGL